MHIKELSYYQEHLSELKIKGLTKDEQETIILIPRCGNTAKVETTDPTVFSKLKKFSIASPDDWGLIGATAACDRTEDIEITSATFECPKKLVSYRSKSSAGRELTEEQRETAALRMKNFWENKRNTD